MSDTGAPSLPSTTVILTVFKDRALLRGHRVWIHRQLRSEDVAVFLTVFFGGYLAVTWRSQVGSASTAMTVLTVFTSCCALTTLALQTFRPLKGSPGITSLKTTYGQDSQ